MASTPVPTLYCSKCGSPTPSTAQFCNNCGTPLPASPVLTTAAFAYGGFWIRVLAAIIDTVIVCFLCSPFAVFLAPGLVRMFRFGMLGDQPDPGAIATLIGGALLFKICVVAVFWLYQALLTSGPWQATIGKKVLGMKVVDLNGRPISFARASGRAFAKLINHMFGYITYIVVAFTARKQGLHDMIAGTMVIKS